VHSENVYLRRPTTYLSVPLPFRCDRHGGAPTPAASTGTREGTFAATKQLGDSGSLARSASCRRNREHRFLAAALVYLVAGSRPHKSQTTNTHQIKSHSTMQHTHTHTYSHGSLLHESQIERSLRGEKQRIPSSTQVVQRSFFCGERKILKTIELAKNLDLPMAIASCRNKFASASSCLSRNNSLHHLLVLHRWPPRETVPGSGSDDDLGTGTYPTAPELTAPMPLPRNSEQARRSTENSGSRQGCRALSSLKPDGEGRGSEGEESK
jgi:hypothetical protein